MFCKWTLQKKYNDLNKIKHFIDIIICLKNELELLIDKIDGVKIIESGSSLIIGIVLKNINN